MAFLDSWIFVGIGFSVSPKTGSWILGFLDSQRGGFPILGFLDLGFLDSTKMHLQGLGVHYFQDLRFSFSKNGPLGFLDSQRGGSPILGFLDLAKMHLGGPGGSLFSIHCVPAALCPCGLSL